MEGKHRGVASRSISRAGCVEDREIEERRRESMEELPPVPCRVLAVWKTKKEERRRESMEDSPSVWQEMELATEGMKQGLLKVTWIASPSINDPTDESVLFKRLAYFLFQCGIIDLAIGGVSFSSYFIGARTLEIDKSFSGYALRHSDHKKFIDRHSLIL
ncbi:hypothetical protein TRIUR3_34433 [Triticum urartu]|uniref:Uncharacterized protein n=1 Tax=Triticum urartu TaxID=4572 RepID=M7Z662_TRIUA|nr:hypothetical protein TRIUR3_34433 [Triticum urartu]